MRTSTDPKVTDQEERERRVQAAQLRVLQETTEWVKSRTAILTSSFLPVELVRERCEQVCNHIWNAPGLDYETCERLTELIFAIAKPPTKRTMSNERNRIPADPLRIAAGIYRGEELAEIA